MCCKIFPIAELEKAAHVKCRHCAQGQGCTIYETRPGTCREFFCSWIIDESFPEDWRPDRSKLVFIPDPNTRNILVHVDPGVPDAWRREPYNSWLRRKAAEGLESGASVIVSIGKRATLVLPDSELFLGDLDERDELQFSRIDGPEGSALEVKVIRHRPAAEAGHGAPDAGNDSAA